MCLKPIFVAIDSPVDQSRAAVNLGPGLEHRLKKQKTCCDRG